MTNSNLLDTKTVKLNEILSNGKIYKVPQFQRDYSWEQDNWEDLWNDIEIARNNKSVHYMGSIVLQSGQGKEYSIIDGQQRFTTLSLLILALIGSINDLINSGIEVEENTERIKILMSQYIGQKDPSSLRYSSKLFLNENNDGFYQSRLLELKDPINERRLSDSEKLMWEAFKFFRSKIRKYFPSVSGQELASFLNNEVGEFMMFIQIIVEDELNAYTVFETLNSRGVELTSTDLLKNYLFSLVAKSSTDLSHVKSQWKKIVDTVGLKDFPVFLRYYLMSTRKQITKEYLFKEIKSFINQGQDVFDLLDNLEFFAYTYVALGNSADDFWKTDKNLRNKIAILKVFRVTQWKTLAMVAYGRMEISDFKRLIDGVIAISYRYNVIAKQQTNEMEKVFSRAAIELFNGTQSTVQAVLFSLRSIYLNDDVFKSYFESKVFNTNNSADKKLIRYTLYKLEAQSPGGANYDFEEDDGTIEHILPESFAGEWQNHFTEEEYEKAIYLIGNMSILEPRLNNKEARDLPFADKKLVFEQSKYALTKSIASENWDLLSIQKRQERLARMACGVWQIQY